MTDVKCADCGFLTVRNTQTRQLDEAEEAFRRGGHIPVEGSRFMHEEYPVCFVRALNFWKVIGQNSTPEARIAIFKQPRQCDRFVTWEQGFSPKEHAEMLHEAAATKRQSEEAERQRQWEQEEGERSRTWQEVQERVSNQRHIQSLIVGVVVTLLAAAIGAAATLIAVG